MMNNHAWLSRAEAALTALENASQADRPEALAQAAGQVGAVAAQFGQLPVAAREQMRPQLSMLLGRIEAAATRLEQNRTSAENGLKDLRHHGAALTAYMVSDAKNRS
jgi:hypothetical protein